MKNAQVSFEFVLIFSLVFFSIMGFLYIANTKLDEINDQKEQLILETVADDIINEVVIASSVEDNYVRKFDVPGRLLGKYYEMSIEDNLLMIDVFDRSGNIYKNYFKHIPIAVKGTFIEKINETNKEHCVSKSDFDGVRISKTQASLDLAPGTGEITAGGEQFEVYLSLHCVENIRSLKFFIEYNETYLDFVDFEVIKQSNYDDRYLNPLFDDAVSYEYGSDDAYITRSLLADSCIFGSGNIAKVTFQTLEQEGDTSIKFHPDFELEIYDCNLERDTKSGLDNSKKDLDITVVGSS